MRVYIRNSAESLVPVTIHKGGTIAALKAAYRRLPAFVGNRNHIQLMFKGEALEDTYTVKHYGIKTDAVIVHPTSSRLQAAYSGIDYDALAAQLEQEYSAMRGGQDFADYDSSQPGGGEDWDTTPQGPREMPYVPRGIPHPPPPPGGAAGGSAASPFADMMALAVARAPGGVVPYGQRAATKRAPQGGPQASAGAVPGPDNWQTPSRTFRQIYVAQVGKFQFRLLHRMEGRWNGDATVLGARGQRNNTPSVVSVSLSWDDDSNVWEETQSLTDVNGIARAQTLQLIPVADGVCKVCQKGSSTWGDVDMELKEQSESVIVLTATSHVSGKPILVETITVVDDVRRVRTVQRFDASGAFQCLYMFNEQRVIDSVSGALVPNSGQAKPESGGQSRGNQGSSSPTIFPRPGVTVAETVDIDESTDDAAASSASRTQTPVRHTPSSTHRGSGSSHVSGSAPSPVV